MCAMVSNHGICTVLKELSGNICISRKTFCLIKIHPFNSGLFRIAAPELPQQEEDSLTPLEERD